MSEGTPPVIDEAFSSHDAFESSGDRYELRTTAFEGFITVTPLDGAVRYSVTATVPRIDGATADPVGDAIVTDWIETFERRLADAPSATRADVTLETVRVEEVGTEVQIEYVFEWGNPETAADIAKTLLEYVEGTYVEGIIPGFEYEPPVSDLLANASQSGKSGTPL